MRGLFCYTYDTKLKKKPSYMSQRRKERKHIFTFTLPYLVGLVLFIDILRYQQKKPLPLSQHCFSLQTLSSYPPLSIDLAVTGTVIAPQILLSRRL